MKSPIGLIDVENSIDDYGRSARRLAGLDAAA